MRLMSQEPDYVMDEAYGRQKINKEKICDNPGCDRMRGDKAGHYTLSDTAGGTVKKIGCNRK